MLVHIKGRTPRVPPHPVTLRSFGDECSERGRLLKSLKKPPELIKRLFECVLILFMEPLILPEVEMVKRLQLCVSWEQASKVMSNASFLDDLGRNPCRGVVIKINQSLFAHRLAKRLACYTLNLNSITSPSCTTYSLPSIRYKPRSRAAAIEPHSIKSV